VSADRDGRAPTFAMFCTYRPRPFRVDDGYVWAIAEVADEIEAVRAYSGHIATHGSDHAPFVHMEPMRDEWRDANTSVGFAAHRADLDPARNLFRQPAERGA
jgi:hypothetical protein